MEKTENKLAVYTICKNELKFVAKWLNSMKEADYMVVLDTGSTDGTYEELLRRKQDYPNLIVRRKVIDPWRFDVARNENLKDIPEDANILFEVDMDEIVRPGFAQAIKSKWIEGTHERGEYLYAWSHTSEGKPARVFWYNKIHSRNWEWKAPVHEYLVRKGTSNADYTREVAIIFSENEVYKEHFPDYTKSRSSYSKLLEQRVNEDPNDISGLIYYIHDCSYSKNYSLAITKIEDLMSKRINSLDSNMISNLLTHKARCLQECGRREEADKCYREAIEKAPYYRTAYFEYARFLIDGGYHNVALDILEQAKEKTVRQYSWIEDDTCWTYGYYDLKCLALYWSGRKEESLKYAVKAWLEDKGNERLKENITAVLNNLDIS